MDQIAIVLMSSDLMIVEMRSQLLRQAGMVPQT